jgi:hypothetical protein
LTIIPVGTEKGEGGKRKYIAFGLKVSCFDEKRLTDPSIVNRKNRGLVNEMACYDFDAGRL